MLYIHTNYSFLILFHTLYSSTHHTGDHETRPSIGGVYRRCCHRYASCSHATISPKKNMRELIVELSIFFFFEITRPSLIQSGGSWDPRGRKATTKPPASYMLVFVQYLLLLFLFLDTRTGTIRSRTTRQHYQQQNSNRLLAFNCSGWWLDCYPPPFLLVHDDYCIHNIRWLCPRVLEGCFERCVLDERR